MSTYIQYPAAGGGSGVTTLAAVGSAPAAEGAAISGSTLTLEPADATHPGVLTTGAQSIAGTKTFAADSTNTITLTGASTGNPPTISVAGGDTNIGLKLLGKGSGSLVWDGSNFNVDSTGFVNATGMNSAGAVGAGGAFQALSDGANVTLKGFIPDSGSAVAVIIDNGAHTLSTAGAKIISIRNNGSEKSFIDLNGALGYPYTDNSGSPGATTISKLSGRAAIASGASSVVVTNTLVSATSKVLVQLETSAAGVGGLVCVPGAGSFTVTSVSGTGVATNTTANCKFSFVVIN